jgi:hypothetical protein
MMDETTVLLVADLRPQPPYPAGLFAATRAFLKSCPTQSTISRAHCFFFTFLSCSVCIPSTPMCFASMWAGLRIAQGISPCCAKCTTASQVAISLRVRYEHGGNGKSKLPFNLTGPIPVVVIKVTILEGIRLDLVEDRSTK